MLLSARLKTGKDQPVLASSGRWMRRRCTPPVGNALYGAHSILGWRDVNGSETVELGGKWLDLPGTCAEAPIQLPRQFHNHSVGSHAISTAPLRTGFREDCTTVHHCAARAKPDPARAAMPSLPPGIKHPLRSTTGHRGSGVGLSVGWPSGEDGLGRRRSACGRRRWACARRRWGGDGSNAPGRPCRSRYSWACFRDRSLRS